MTKQPWISVSHILLPKYFTHSHPISHSKPNLCFFIISHLFFQSYFLSSKNTLFLVKACLIWPLAYFFPLSFWHIIIISSFLKHQKTNTRAFRSKGAICPHIPSFILCFLFHISRLDIYHPSLLYMFAVSTMSLLPCSIPKVSGPN